MKPILTHPERNPTLQRDPKRLTEWMRIGLLTQITAGSVTGLMGREARSMAHRLLENRWVHFIATDAHNTDKRAPRMREAHDLIAKKFSPTYAKRICLDNPLAAYENRPLPQQEEPRNLYRNDAQLTRRWWQIFWKPDKEDDDLD
jgi:protein-tyrosine phosphatase